jgi:hypothetical protein
VFQFFAEFGKVISDNTVLQDSAISSCFGFWTTISCYVKNPARYSYPCNRPRRPMGVWDVSLPHFLDNRLINACKVVSLTRRPPFYPPGKFLVLISVRGWVDPRGP